LSDGRNSMQDYFNMHGSQLPTYDGKLQPFLQAKSNNVTYSWFAWRIIMGSGFDDWVYWHFFTIKVIYNSSHIQLILSGVCLANLYEDSLTNLGLISEFRMSLSLSLMFRPNVSQLVSLGIKYSSGAYAQIFITLRQLRVCWCGEFSLTRGRVCRLQLLLALSSAVILGSESRGTRDHILLSQIRDFPFRRLLRLAGSRWRYSTPPPHRIEFRIHESTPFYV
jgi:hypothetical protein